MVYCLLKTSWFILYGVTRLLTLWRKFLEEKSKEPGLDENLADCDSYIAEAWQELLDAPPTRKSYYWDYVDTLLDWRLELTRS